MMKFNQKIYLIPAAKYEKIIQDTKETPEAIKQSDDPSHTSIKIENTTVPHTEQIQSFKDESEILPKIHEDQNFEPGSTDIQKTEKVTDYSQKIASFSEKPNHHQAESVRDAQKLKGVTKAKDQKKVLKFPPPGLPNLEQLANIRDNKEQSPNSFQSVNRRPNHSIKTKKINSWIKLK